LHSNLGGSVSILSREKKTRREGKNSIVIVRTRFVNVCVNQLSKLRLRIECKNSIVIVRTRFVNVCVNQLSKLRLRSEGKNSIVIVRTRFVNVWNIFPWKCDANLLTTQ